MLGISCYSPFTHLSSSLTYYIYTLSPNLSMYKVPELPILTHGKCWLYKHPTLANIILFFKSSKSWYLKIALILPIKYTRLRSLVVKASGWRSEESKCKLPLPPHCTCQYISKTANVNTLSVEDILMK